MSQNVNILKRALHREKAARKSAEKILEAKSRELYHSAQKVETLLEEKTNQLQGVFENIIDAYVIMDTLGNVIKFNEAASDLFGYNIEAEWLNVIDLVFEEDIQYVMDAFRNLQKHGFFKNFEARVYTKTKEVKWVHINASLILDKDKSAIAAQGIVRDITDFKNLEIQKEKLVQKLEHSNAMLQDYAHIVSHDLKSPLRSIDALVNWIKEDNAGKLDDTSLKNLNLIEVTLEKMEKLITDVLDYSSIDAMDNENLDVNIDTLIKEHIDIIYIPDDIEIKILNTLPTVKGDQTKLLQIFQNLIDNAIKFNDKEKGLIEIGVKELRTCYQFSIKDKGIGIDEKFHDKIFSIFNSLKKNKNSTGIGLSIVKKIVESHGGKIWLESILGKGSTFYFTLKK